MCRTIPTATPSRHTAPKTAAYTPSSASPSWSVSFAAAGTYKSRPPTTRTAFLVVWGRLFAKSWLIDAGRNGSGPREAYFKVNNILGLVRACQQGLGIAALPDYLVEENNRLVQLFGETDSIQVDTYFVYPEELKTVARVQVFRDFVVSKAQRWPS